MKEIGMLFSGPMVRAILDGRKTRTCRIINPQPRVVLAQYYDGSIETNQIFRHGDQRLHCRVQPGDRIYVRETFAYAESPEYPANRDYKPVDTNFIYPVETDGKVYVIYRADGDTSWGSFDGDNLNKDGTEKSYWRPSIHMPKAAARIWLEVTDVRPERLLDISSHDANCEGFTEAGTHPRAEFLAAWDQLYGSGAAEADPWVWVIEFKQIEVK